MTSTRFLTGSLATLAVASAFTLASPSAHAAEPDDRPCGQPGIEAVYESVTVPPIYRTVPEVVHSEWLWEREVPTYEFEFSKQISPAVAEYDWTREVPGPTEYLFTRTVVDSPAIPGTPAVPEVGHFETVVITPAVLSTEVEYQHQRNGQLRWEDENWGAQNGEGKGWSKTGNTRFVEITPAVTIQTWIIDVPAQPAVPGTPEVSHVEELWAPASPGGDWTGPTAERPGAPTTENATTDGEAPAGDGWTLVETRTTDAVVDTVWAAVAPDGYAPTGASRDAGTSREETITPAAEAPAGDGWAKVDGSEVVVVDVPVHEELVTPGSVEQVLISPAIPATESCVAPPTDEVATPGGDEVAGPEAAQGAPASAAEVLPNTGNDLPAWMAPAGFAVVIAGVGMIRYGRRTGEA